jgi:hypothetical protein
LDALDFVPNESDTEWQIIGNDQKGCTAGLCEFSHTLNLPTGARIVNFRVEGCIYSPYPSGLEVRLRSCSVGAACTDLDSVTASGTGCGPWSKPVSFTVNNYQSYYVVTVLSYGSTSFRGAKVHYDLQVSPGPATPTFGDVPTSSGMYKFVEALAASGITGGCGGGNFCPNNPVTRGQMAVFLASALGLHW